MESRQERNNRRAAEQAVAAAFAAEHADLLAADVVVVETADESSVETAYVGDAGDLDRDVRTDRAAEVAQVAASVLSQQYLGVE